VSGPLVITVGTVLNRRCLPELLRASAKLVRRRPGLVLDVVGENRTHPRLDLEARADEMGIRRCVRFPASSRTLRSPTATRPPTRPCSSRVRGLRPPRPRGRGPRRSLVVSRAPALGEVFPDAALLVDPRDETDVAAALDRVLMDEGLRVRLVEAGRALAARHSWADAARRTREALLEAAGR